MKIKYNKLPVLLALLYASYVIWWLSFQSNVESQGLAVQWFGATYGGIALVASIIGFVTAKKWGGFKTVLGKAINFFSFGLLAQELGQLIYTYYIYSAHQQIPYPSFGDIAYMGSVILYIIATVYLGRAAGIKYSLHRSLNRIMAVVIPLAILLTSCFILLHHHAYDTGHPLTVFLDFGYPVGQAIYISLAINAYILSRKLLGGKMRVSIFLTILALFIQYSSDFTFIYQSSRGTFIAGEIVDLLYLSAYFVMGLALISFYKTYIGLRGDSNV